MTTAMATRETIRFDNEAAWLEARTKDITSTEIAALFGCSPYVTEFELWHRKRDGGVVQFDPSERVRWGSRLEAAIAAGLAEDNNWTIRRMGEYMRDPELRIGASFDYKIMPDGGILEIKNVDSLIYREGWIVDGDHVEAPPHIEFQIQHQLLVSQEALGRIGALVGGNRVCLLVREPSEKVMSAITKKVSEFWKSIEANEPPAPDFGKDAAFISKLYSHAEDGKVITATNQLAELAEKYQEAQFDEKSGKLRKEAVKAEMLTLIGDAEKVIGANFNITAGEIGPSEIAAYTRAGYRNWKVNFKKTNRG